MPKEQVNCEKCGAVLKPRWKPCAKCGAPPPGKARRGTSAGAGAETGHPTAASAAEQSPDSPEGRPMGEPTSGERSKGLPEPSAEEIEAERTLLMSKPELLKAMRALTPPPRPKHPPAPAPPPSFSEPLQALPGRVESDRPCEWCGSRRIERYEDFVARCPDCGRSFQYV